MTYTVLEFVRNGRRYYYSWKTSVARENVREMAGPSKLYESGRVFETFDTEEEAMTCVRRESDNAGT